jgi:hypothetical protein
MANRARGRGALLKRQELWLGGERGRWAVEREERRQLRLGKVGWGGQRTGRFGLSDTKGIQEREREGGARLWHKCADQDPAIVDNKRETKTTGGERERGNCVWNFFFWSDARRWTRQVERERERRRESDEASTVPYLSHVGWIMEHVIVDGKRFRNTLVGWTIISTPNGRDRESAPSNLSLWLDLLVK